jgi:hydrogenase expression/formation protein HypD
MALSAQQWLVKINELPVTETTKIMNVCGGHERTIALSGLRSVLPEWIELIPGPGCPVCVCPEEDIYQAIQLSLEKNIIVAAFGDMLRVPVNAGKQSIRTLSQAKAAGADIRAIASPIETLTIAKENPGQTVVFFAAGFETTFAPVAAMLAEGAPGNLLILSSGRLTWPAVALLLDSEQPNFDALIAPGHVATVMGPEQWQFVVSRHQLPVAIAGFTPDSLLAAIYSVLRQRMDGHLFVDNCYEQVVKPGGNRRAQKLIAHVFEVSDAPWRGIGTIPRSGYTLQAHFSRHDVQLHFGSFRENARRHVGEMPPGCDCARVVMGKIKPIDCKLYGRLCVPSQPVGPCMVSDEGACRIWWSAGIKPDVELKSTELT